jgi:hypothetical protein
VGRWWCKSRFQPVDVRVSFAIVENGDGDDFNVTNVLCEVRVVRFVK